MSPRPARVGPGRAALTDALARSGARSPAKRRAEEVGRVFLPVARTGWEAVRVSAIWVGRPVRGAVAGVDRVCRVTNRLARAAACRDGRQGAFPEHVIAHRIHAGTKISQRDGHHFDFNRI